MVLFKAKYILTATPNNNKNTTTPKNNIMSEAADLFYVEDFYGMLDSNPNLICFKNGVVDIKNKVFR